MPRVLSYTPSWLSRPSAGFDVFAVKQEALANGSSKSSKSSKHADFNVPSKTIACRGTEVFVAVGNEIRWSDLAWLKEIEEDRTKSGEFTSGKQGYRVSAGCPECNFMLTRPGPQSKHPRRDQAIGHLAARRLSSRSDNLYRPRYLPTQPGSFWPRRQHPIEAKVVPTGADCPCGRTTSRSLRSLASSWRARKMPRHNQS